MQIHEIVYVVNARMPTTRAHGLQIAQTADALMAEGHSVTLLSPFSFEKSDAVARKYTLRRLAALDLPFLGRFRFYLRSVSYIPSLYLYLLWKAVTMFVCKKKVTIYVRGEIIFVLLPFRFLFPIFFETHQIRNHEHLYKIVLRKLSGLVVITDRLKTRLGTEFGVPTEKVLVARDAVDLDRFITATKSVATYQKCNIPAAKKIVMYTGSLGFEKGAHTFAEAARYLPDDVQVVIVGGLEYQLPDFKEKYGHVRNLTIVGQVSHKEIPEVLQVADVLVQPDLATDTYSNLYTSPMKLFEYMASGKPIVASDVPSLREVLDDSSAFFFSSGDALHLADVIVRVLQNEALAHQKAVSARREASYFTWEKRAQEIGKFILATR